MCREQSQDFTLTLTNFRHKQHMAFCPTFMCYSDSVPKIKASAVLIFMGRDALLQRN